MKRLMLLLLIPFNVAAWETTVTCELPTTREGGGALPESEIAHVIFRIAFCNGPSIDYIETACSTIQITNERPCEVSAAVVDTEGLQSDFNSSALLIKFKPSAPSGVAGLSIDRN